MSAISTGGEGESDPDNLWQLTLEQVMDPDPCCVRPDTPVADVITLINTGHPQPRGYALVVTPDSGSRYGKLLGLLTEREVVALVTQGGDWDDCPVSGVMMVDPPRLRASDFDTIWTPLQLMHTHHLAYLPVINHKDQVIGILKPNLNQWVCQLLQQVRAYSSQLETWTQESSSAAESTVDPLTDYAALDPVDKASFLDDLKDDFLSIISHELRTPITSIQLALHMIKNTSSEEKREQYYQIAVENCNLQRDLINDLLDLQRLEANAYHLHRQTEGIPGWLESFLTRYSSQYQISRHMVQLTISPQVNLLKTDYTALCRILREFLVNAYKYSTSGSLIEFSVATQDQGILFSMQNNSTIAPQDLPYIFDKFYRAHHSDRWKYRGMGLGLALIRELVGLLQGHISVSSQEDCTIFSVWIPNFPDDDT